VDEQNDDSPAASRVNKVKAVKRWLTEDRPGVRTTVQERRGLILMAEVDSLDQHGRPDLFVFTTVDVVKWYDRAARSLIKTGGEWSDALADCWPAPSDAEPEPDPVVLALVA
jgi:hypothetical protein